MIGYILIIILKLTELYYLTRKYKRYENVDKQLILTSIILLIVIQWSCSSPDAGMLQAIAAILLVMGLYISWKKIVWFQFWIIPVWIAWIHINPQNKQFIRPNMSGGYGMVPSINHDYEWYVGSYKYPLYVALGQNRAEIAKNYYLPEVDACVESRDWNRIMLDLPKKVFFSKDSTARGREFNCINPILLSYGTTNVLVGNNHEIYQFNSGSPIVYFSCFPHLKHLYFVDPDETYCYAITSNNECFLLYDLHTGNIKSVDIPFQFDPFESNKLWSYICGQEVFSYTPVEQIEFNQSTI